MFEVASDAEFTSKVFARNGVPGGDGGRTTVQVDRLDIGRAYFWRARAEDGANSSQFASAQFEVLPKPVLNAPGLVSPVNNERVGSKRPTLTVNASDRNAAIGNLRYEFQVAFDQGFGQLVSGRHRRGAGPADRALRPHGDLPDDRQHFWRCVSSDGEATSGVGHRRRRSGRSWAHVRAPDPDLDRATAESCASNNGDRIVRCVAAKYPERLAAGVSLDRRIGNMEFLRNRIIEAGICGGLDLAWNKKRGTGRHSIDALAWRHNGIDDVVDVGSAYDDTSRPLRDCSGESWPARPATIRIRDLAATERQREELKARCARAHRAFVVTRDRNGVEVFRPGGSRVRSGAAGRRRIGSPRPSATRSAVQGHRAHGVTRRTPAPSFGRMSTSRQPRREDLGLGLLGVGGLYRDRGSGLGRREPVRDVLLHHEDARAGRDPDVDLCRSPAPSRQR